MIRKALKAMSGLKATTVLSDKNHKPYKHKGADSAEKINMCLTCNKPVSKCKGDCFGRG